MSGLGAGALLKTRAPGDGRVERRTDQRGDGEGGAGAQQYRLRPLGRAGLVIGHSTVKTHVTRLLTRLDLRDPRPGRRVRYETGFVLPGQQPG